MMPRCPQIAQTYVKSFPGNAARSLTYVWSFCGYSAWYGKDCISEYLDLKFLGLVVIIYQGISFKKIFLLQFMMPFSKSSRFQMFFQVGVLKTFEIFTGKHLCWSLFLIRCSHWTCSIKQKQPMEVPYNLCCS